MRNPVSEYAYIHSSKNTLYITRESDAVRNEDICVCLADTISIGYMQNVITVIILDIDLIRSVFRVFSPGRIWYNRQGVGSTAVLQACDA